MSQQHLITCGVENNQMPKETNIKSWISSRPNPNIELELSNFLQKTMHLQINSLKKGRIWIKQMKVWRILITIMMSMTLTRLSYPKKVDAFLVNIKYFNGELDIEGKRMFRDERGRGLEWVTIMSSFE